MTEHVTVYINGELVDVDPSIHIIETKKINNFFEIKDRDSNTTNDFNLLLTKQTEKSLDYIGLKGNSSIKPYRYLKAEIYRNGTPTITDGTALLLETNSRNKAKVQILDGNNSIYEVLGSESISSLDFSSIGHALTKQNYVGSFEHTYKEGYIYPIANYGVFDKDNIVINYQVPCLFMRWIWDQIFKESGFDWIYRGDENPLESEQFLSQVISLDKGYESEIDDDPAELYIELTNSLTIENTTYLAFIELFDLKEYHSISSSPNGTESLIVFKENNYYDFVITGSLNSTQPISLIIEKDGDVFMKLVTDSVGNQIINYNSVAYISSGSSLKFYIEAKGTEQYSFNLNIKILKDNSNEFVNFNSFYSDITKVDFIKSVMQQFGLVHQRIKGTNTYEFIRLEDIFTKKTDIVDWSDKFHSLDTESYDVGGCGKKNHFKYQYDNEDDSFSDGFFKIDHDFIDEEKTLLTSPFKAPKSGSDSFLNQIVYDIPLFEIEFDENGNVETIEPTTSKPYILTLEKFYGDLNYSTKDGNGGFHRGYIPVATFRGLNYNEIIGENYTSFSRSLNRMYKVEAKVALNALDIYNVDFFNLFYLRQLGYYFYLNEIKNYKGQYVTKVELIRVDSTLETNGEYNDDYSNDYFI